MVRGLAGSSRVCTLRTPVKLSPAGKRAACKQDIIYTVWERDRLWKRKRERERERERGSYTSLHNVRGPRARWASVEEGAAIGQHIIIEIVMAAINHRRFSPSCFTPRLQFLVRSFASFILALLSPVHAFPSQKPPRSAEGTKCVNEKSS